MSAIVATQVNGVMVVDSRLIAEDIGIAHNALMQNIRNHKTRIEQDFGSLQFQIEVKTKDVGATQERFCYLTEDQSYFILTLSRNTERVMDAKAALVKAFSRLRQEQIISVAPETDEMLMARAIQASARLLESAKQEIKELKEEAAENAPKVKMATVFIERGGLTLIGNFAKDHGGIGRNDLFKLLRDKKVLYKLSDNSHEPYQRFIKAGLFVLKPAGVNVFGREKYTTMLTPEGVQWLCKRLEDWLSGE